MAEHPKVQMGANLALKQARKLEREAMVTGGVTESQEKSLFDEVQEVLEAIEDEAPDEVVADEAPDEVVE
jgi:hypothetical protein